MAARVRISIALTSNESIGKRESILPHHHRRAHLDHPGSPVLGERHEIGDGEVARHNRWQHWPPVIASCATGPS